MSAGEHYWLFRAENPTRPEDAEPAIAQPFTSLDDARDAALSAGGNLDIFSTPGAGGGWHFVEHVELVTTNGDDG